MKENDESSLEHIAERLEWLRKHYGLTQVEFADSLGFGKTQYNNWKSARQRLSLDGALKINTIYGTSLDFLFLGRLESLSDQMRKSWIDRYRDSSSS